MVSTRSGLQLVLLTLMCGAARAMYNCSCCSQRFDRVTWTGAEVDFGCSEVDQMLRDSGKYVSKNAIALRAQIYRDEVFLALPRFKSGVASTLARTCLTQNTCEAKLVPFPSINFQQEGKADEIQNAVDLFVDCQDVLWVLDTGIIYTLDSCPQRTGPPTVWAFSVCTGKLLKKIDLTCLTTPMSRLQYLVVDYGTCGKCFVYVSDAANRALIVFDVAENKGTRVVLPKAITAGCSKRDVLYIALMRSECGPSALIVTYLSGTRVFTLRTEYLRSGSAGKIIDMGPKTDKMVILGTDGGTSLFFRYAGAPDVYKWDVGKPFVSDNIVMVYRPDSCLLATQVMVDYERNRMMVLESNFPDFTNNNVGCGIMQTVRPLDGCS